MLRRGTPAFARANVGVAAAGFATFALLYCVQPLMPVFTAEFGIPASTSSLSLSLATGALAPMLIVASSLSEAWGRRGIMACSIAASAVLTVAGGLAGSFDALLAFRALAGVAMSGVPAVAMAYLGEEVEAASLGVSVGLVVGGNAVGGLTGRVVAGVLADLVSWRAGLLGIGAAGLLAAAAVWRLLPPSRHFAPRPLRFGPLLASLGTHLADEGLPLLFALGFLLMGSFVTLYNYLGYRLIAAPYGLGSAAVSGVFTLYLIGIVGSASMGRLADRMGRRRVLWVMVAVMLAGVLLTLAAPLGLIVAGVAVATFGFFGAHSVASSWVTRRARTARAQAASLYLFAYYLGSSVVGYAGGLVWAAGGWTAVALMLAALLLLALGMSLRLHGLRPLPEA